MTDAKEVNVVEQIAQDRAKTYGDFGPFAILVNTMERICFSHMQQYNPDGLNKMHPVMIEGMHMILHKIARAVNGDPTHADSWRDIAGYATLVADRIPLILGNLSQQREEMTPAQQQEETTPLVMGGASAPVGGVHPHEEEPRHDHDGVSDIDDRKEFVQRY